MARTKNYHLQRRGKVWQYRRDVPKDIRSILGEPAVVRAFSLKTRDLQHARELRDQYDKRVEREWSKLRLKSASGRFAASASEAVGRNDPTSDSYDPMQPLDHKAVALEREAFDGGLDATPILDSLADSLDSIAAKFVEHPDAKGGYDLDVLRDLAVEHNPTAAALQQRVDEYNGSIGWESMGSQYLDGVVQLSKKTRSDYRKAFSVAEQELPKFEGLTRQLVQRWVNKSLNIRAEATVKKYLSGLRSALKFQGEPLDIFRDLSFSGGKPATSRDILTYDEIALLLARCDSPSLEAAIWIGLYTGRRQSAIVGMTYDPDKDLMLFPAVKTEVTHSYLPCPDDIRQYVLRWDDLRRSTSTLGSAFTKLRDACGIGQGDAGGQKVFHSLRHTFVSRAQEGNAIPYEQRSLISGHRIGNLHSDLYGSKGDPEALRCYMNAVKHMAAIHAVGPQV